MKNWDKFGLNAQHDELFASGGEGGETGLDRSQPSEAMTQPPKCCGVCARWEKYTLVQSTPQMGVCSVTRYLVPNDGRSCQFFTRNQAVPPPLPWKRDHDDTWFVRSGDVELTVKYNLEVERWEWCAGMAVDEWIECERGLRKTRAGAMRAAEAHVERVRSVLGNGG